MEISVRPQKATAVQQKLPLYPVYCTGCGEELSDRFFPIDNLLRQYFNGGPADNRKEKFIQMMGISVAYGKPVLPQAPMLLENGKFVRPTKDALDRLTQEAPPCFSCEGNALPGNTMKPITLNIASMVYQFYRISEFYDIYQMLELRQSMNAAVEAGYTVSGKAAAKMQVFCHKFEALPYVRMPGMTIEDQRQEAIMDVLDWILFSAAAEEGKSSTHFATEEIRVGWRYKLVNGREMPYALAAVGANGNDYSSTGCRCGKCYQPIPYQLGAYEQRVIGLLGTQSTGKTTYLAALADAIDKGELTSLSRNGSNVTAEVTIQACIAGDAQWAKVNHGPTDRMENADATGLGLLWLYQHGFPPAKTEVTSSKDAAALTFLISSPQKAPVMYTIADISGEAFYNAVSKKWDDTLVGQQQRRLDSCAALIQVISNRQLTGQGEYVTSATEVQNCYKKYLQSRALNTAVVLTSADEINGGNLRKPMHLAYDLKKISPLLWSEEKQQAVLNAELLDSASRGVEEYLDGKFGSFMNTLREAQKQAGESQQACAKAFAVSSGTQKATIDFTDSDESYRSEDAVKARYKEVRESRFGVGAPLLWLLAQDGMLDTGSADRNERV